jgi:hypothetical protein
VKKIVLSSIVLVFFSNAYGGITYPGSRKIVDIGCHKNDNTCFISIDGEPAGPSDNCRRNSIRWNVEEANGKAALTHFTAAYFAGKRVKLGIDSSCYPHQSNFPTFHHYYIVD